MNRGIFVVVLFDVASIFISGAGFNDASGDITDSSHHADLLQFDYREVTCGQTVIDEISNTTAAPSGWPRPARVFKFTYPTSADSFQVTTCHRSTHLDTVLHLLNDDGPLLSEDVTLIVQDDQFCNSNVLGVGGLVSAFYSDAPAYDNVTIEPGEDYFIVVDAANDDRGTFGLVVECFEPPHVEPDGICSYLPEVAHQAFSQIPEGADFGAVAPLVEDFIFGVNSAHECCRRCLDVETCEAFTWLPYDLGYCAMFGDAVVGEHRFDAFVISGVIDECARDDRVLLSLCRLSRPLSTFTIFAVSFAGLALLLFFSGIVVAKCRGVKGNHFVIILVALAVLDFATDCDFAHSLRIELGMRSPLTISGLMFIFLPIAVNFVLVFALITRELRDEKVHKWFKGNPMLATLLILLSLCVGRLEALMIFNAGSLFGSRAALFRAPFSEAMKSRLVWFGLMSHLLEDVPQLSIQLVTVFQQGGLSNNQALFIAMGTSALALVFGMLKKVLFCVADVQKGAKANTPSAISISDVSASSVDLASASASASVSVSSTSVDLAASTSNVLNPFKQSQSVIHSSASASAVAQFQESNSSDAEPENVVQMSTRSLDVLNSDRAVNESSASSSSSRRVPQPNMMLSTTTAFSSSDDVDGKRRSSVEKSRSRSVAIVPELCSM